MWTVIQNSDETAKISFIENINIYNFSFKLCQSEQGKIHIELNCIVSIVISLLDII